MTKCNHCGNVNTAGAVRCQSCGSVLSSGIDTSGSSSNVASQDQSALPAWLESLRVGERVPRPVNNSPQFSPTDLIEEGSLPSWMHAQRNEMQNVTGASLPVSMGSSALSASSTDSDPISANSFNVQSLIDEQSLPSWMQEGQVSTSLSKKDSNAAENGDKTQEGQASLSLSPGNGISAERLVDQGSVPDWMRSLGPQSGASQGQSGQSASTEGTVNRVEPASSSPAFASGFAARDLVDQQALPDWMTQLEKQAPTTSSNRDQVNEQQPQSIQPGQKGFAARDLIDQQSLPSWMVQQNGQSAPTATGGGQAKQTSQSGIGLSASSLLDMNALPSWMAQNGQAQTVSPANSQPPSSTVSPNQSWLSQQPAAQGSPVNFSSGADGGLAASSVIDMNVLPEWLRSSGGQHATPEIASQPYAAPNAGPPRVENVRVPSRPRSEMSSSETSEMAASVFASMLGVASTAPSFPQSSGAPYQQQPGQPNNMEQMTLSGVAGIASMPSQIGMSMAGIGNGGGASMAGMPGGQGGQSMTGVPGGSGIYGMPGGQSGQSMTGVPGGSGIYGMPGGQGGQSMTGVPGGSGIYGMPGGQGGQSMGGVPGGSGYSMPGGQGGQSMGGVPGGSGIYGMPGGQGGQSMGGVPGGSGIYGMPGGQGGQSMVGIAGRANAQSMVGNAYKNSTGTLAGPYAQGAAGEDKNIKKRGLFGALLDWLSR